MSARGLIVVIEDEHETSDLIKVALREDGYEVRTALDAFQGKGLIARHDPDLVILDRKLPDSDGLEICRWIRQNEKTKTLPIIFLTGKKSPADKVAGLSVGGDDYLTKPFSPEELLARVQAVLRRTRGEPAAQGALVEGGLKIDLSARKAYYEDKGLNLSPKEFELLQVFMERKGRALSRQFLLSHVWGYDKELELSTKVVDVTVGHLRDKMFAAGKRIVPVTGYGYRLEAEDS